MRSISDIKIIETLKMLKNMIIKNDDIIIDNDFNFSINSLNNKNIKNENKKKVLI